MGFLFEKLAGVKNDELEKVKAEVLPEQQKEVQFKKVYHTELKKIQQDVNQIVGYTEDRYYWADVLSEVRQALIRVEQGHQSQAADGCGRLDGADGQRRTQGRGGPGGPVRCRSRASLMLATDAAAQEAFKRRYGLDRAAPSGAAANGGHGRWPLEEGQSAWGHE